MPEKDQLFSSNVKYGGVFDFKDFYKFAYEWLTEEFNLLVTEEKYEEKIKGSEKELKIEWVGVRKVTDYFKYEVKVKYEIKALKDVQIEKDGKRIKTNDGSVKTTIKGTLIRDYEGKFETSGFQKFLRSIYEKWVIPSRIEEYEEKLILKCDEFLQQIKAWLSLEGKR